MGWPDAAVTIVFIVCLALCWCYFLYITKDDADDDET